MNFALEKQMYFKLIYVYRVFNELVTGAWRNSDWKLRYFATTFDFFIYFLTDFGIQTRLMDYVFWCLRLP